MRILFILLILFFSSTVSAQEFQCVYSTSGVEHVNSLIQQTDQSYLAFGMSTSLGQNGINGLIFKIDGMGELLWTKVLDHAGGTEVMEAQPTPDGDVIIAVLASGSANGYDSIIAKMNAEGEILWAKTISGPGAENPVSLLVSNNEIVLLSGSSSFSLDGDQGTLLTKLDLDGNLIWMKFFDLPGYEKPLKLIEHPSGGYAVWGHLNHLNSASYDAWMMHIADSGDFVFANSYGGPTVELAWSALAVEDGIIVSGDTDSFGQGSNDMYLMKLGDSGEILWQKTYGGQYSEHAVNLIAGKGDKLVVGGLTSSLGAGGLDMLSMELSADGEIQWVKSYGGTDKEVCYDIQYTPDGGYMMAGYTRSFANSFAYDIYFVKTNDRGDCGCHSTLDGNLVSADTDMVVTPLSFTSLEVSPFQDVLLTMVSSDGLVGEALCSSGSLSNIGGGDGGTSSGDVVGLTTQDTQILDLYANPQNGSLVVTIRQNEAANLSVYNAHGQVVQNLAIEPAGQQTVELKVGSLSPGIYVVTLLSRSGSATKKLFIH
jgi:hypothetical protein